MLMVCRCQINFCSGFARNCFHICFALFKHYFCIGHFPKCGKWELEKADWMTAWLILSQAGNKYTAAKDKTFTALFRQTLFHRLLPAYIFIDPLCYAKRSHSYCLATLQQGCIYHLAHRNWGCGVDFSFSTFVPFFKTTIVWISSIISMSSGNGVICLVAFTPIGLVLGCCLQTYHMVFFIHINPGPAVKSAWEAH